MTPAPLKKVKRERKGNFHIDPQLSTLFDMADDIKICMLDTEGTIIGWNKSAERMTGYAQNEVVGKNYSMFVSVDERNRNVFKKALHIAEKKGEFNAEGVRVRKDGSHFWARTFITPVFHNKKLSFFAVITRDATREKDLRDKREEYIGIASHELKNPITTLSLYSELLGRRLELDQDKKNLHMLRDIQGQAARLITLVDDLLVVGNIEGGKLDLIREEFNIKSFISKIILDIRNNAPNHKITISGSVRRNVYADKARIAQVVVNLISNAVKYSPHAMKVIIKLHERKTQCEIGIQDFGSGITKMDQRRIFARYFRSGSAEAGNVAGSGLGLYISKAIIAKHHQRLWVKSSVGKGTTFSFTLSFAKKN